jgi:beta-galactosidase
MEQSVITENLPAFPYGAVYFRKSNPPRDDWERDYQTAADDGMNVFRHWFMWSAIEIAPEVFDWDDYDRQLELAERHGIKTIIAELAHAAPEWAFRRLAHARYERSDGTKVESRMRNSSATGGFPGLCLDNEDARHAAGRFLTELTNRYKGHPALGAYDVWNECNLFSSGFTECYCPATLARFRDWLREKYGDVKTTGEAWRRYSLADWEDVQPPRQTDAYPESLDWAQFRIDNAYRLLQWRVELLRGLDPDHPITAHGVAASPISRIAQAADDHWRAAEQVDGYGFTWGGATYGNEAWKQYHVVDMVRSGARHKDFWHSEATAGPNWLNPERHAGRPREDGRVPTAADVRLWNFTSFAAGARGLMYNRWRPLLDGPLFDSLAAYEMDGSRSPRSEMASRIARWANAKEQQALWQSRPVRGEIGIVFDPETAIFCNLQQGREGHYAGAARGAYRGFFDNGIQADWVHIDDIDRYDLLYLPHPLMMCQSAADTLIRWVEGGGNLISEGCPGYFGDRGRAGTTQPNLGLDRLFGATQAYVEFIPDLVSNLRIDVKDAGVAPGGLYLQAYGAVDGTASGRYPDGRIAIVDNTFGHGRTRLIGTSPGYGYETSERADVCPFFAELLAWAGKDLHIRTSDARVTARLHDGDGGRYLWVTNPSQDAINATLTLSSAWEPFRKTDVLWGTTNPTVTEGVIEVEVPARDAVIARLVS